MKRWIAVLMASLTLIFLTACSGETPVSTSSALEQESLLSSSEVSESMVENTGLEANTEADAPEGFLLITGGTFDMGSPDSEAWRSADETQHSVTVSDFYMSAYEVTQQEYQEVMGENPSNFSGENLPVESISWLDAVTYCNARSEQEGLTPVYY